jgi:hypothetical protein
MRSLRSLRSDDQLTTMACSMREVLEPHYRHTIGGGSTRSTRTQEHTRTSTTMPTSPRRPLHSLRDDVRRAPQTQQDCVRGRGRVDTDRAGEPPHCYRGTFPQTLRTLAMPSLYSAWVSTFDARGLNHVDQTTVRTSFVCRIPETPLLDVGQTRQGGEVNVPRGRQ